ncbi:MAG: phosphate ABC transporter substrate-binding protein [Desulfobacteraceae bacterium IS3]|nr:MAG: phosphate ABC transporter substrate-binding protein [Desulfobacteraceae bacterium IS3]
MKKGKSFIVLAVTLGFMLATTAAYAGNLVINGSTTVLPIAQKVAEAYMKEHPDVKITLSGGGSGDGIKAIIDGTTDIANASRDMKDKEIALAKEKGVMPVKHTVAYDCIIPVVHASNTVKDLTMEQLKGIYKGEIKNWKEVGGPDLQITVISRDTSSGTYEVWEEKIMKKERVFPGALLQASSGAIVQAVSKNKNAVGYIGIGYVTADIKALSVNGVAGSKTSALDGTFPISRPLFMFTKGEPEGDAKNFLIYVKDPQKGQKYVEESGYVPLQ